MKNIILKGASNTGKTHTLKCLINLMLKDPAFKLFDYCRDFFEKLNNHTPNVYGDMPDVWAKFCCKGIHILVTTRGDSPSDTINDFKRLKLSCDIFVCACHDTAKSIDTLKKHIEVTDDDFINKKITLNKIVKDIWEIENNKQAQELFEKIKNIIKVLV